MKIKVEICVGTTCYVMGGANLTYIINDLEEDEKNNVEVKISPCIDICNKENAKPPYAIVNGKVIQEATKDKLLSEIRKLLKQ